MKAAWIEIREAMGAQPSWLHVRGFASTHTVGALALRQYCGVGLGGCTPKRVHMQPGASGSHRFARSRPVQLDLDLLQRFACYSQVVMNSLLQLLPTMLRLSGDNEQVREQAVFSAWQGVTSNQLSKACVPFRLFGKTLVIATRDKTWKTQLERDAPGWIFKLNSLFGAPLVTFIEFRVDRAAIEKAQPKPDESMDVGSVQESREYLMPAAMHIEDEALRETFLRAASKCLAMKKDRE